MSVSGAGAAQVASEWLLACCDPDRLRAGDELDRPGVWSIPFFETDRATGKIS